MLFFANYSIQLSSLHLKCLYFLAFLRKNIKYLRTYVTFQNFCEPTFLYVEYCVLAYSIIERLFLLLVNAKRSFFVVKYSTFLPYPALLIHFWRFSLFFVVKALFYRVALNMVYFFKLSPSFTKNKSCKDLQLKI